MSNELKCPHGLNPSQFCTMCVDGPGNIPTSKLVPETKEGYEYCTGPSRFGWFPKETINPWGATNNPPVLTDGPAEGIATEDDDLTDEVCPNCGEEGVAYGAYCHQTGKPWAEPGPVEPAAPVQPAWIDSPLSPTEEELEDYKKLFSSFTLVAESQPTPVVVPDEGEVSKRINDKPPSHWTENDGWKRHPQSVDEWNWHNDAYPDTGKRSELRLNFSCDLLDPHAPDQMAVVLRIDLLRVMGRMQHAEAYKRFHLERKSADSVLTAQPAPLPSDQICERCNKPRHDHKNDLCFGNDLCPGTETFKPALPSDQKETK